MFQHDIPDGCTRRALLDCDGRGRAPWCDYRPLLDSQRVELARRLRDYADAGELSESLIERCGYTVLERQVVDWNLAEADGRPLPLHNESLRRLSRETLIQLLDAVTGLKDVPAERAREESRCRNLAEGATLLLEHPRLATRDCADCLTHVYDEAAGNRVEYSGKPIPRPRGTCAPCRIPHVGCPKGSPEAPRTLTPQNERVWLFDRECRGTGRYPDDALVARHAAIIRAAEAGLRRKPE